MFQTTSDAISAKDNGSENIGVFSDTLFLPAIQKKPVTRGSSNQNKQIKKQNLGLPSLKIDSQPFIHEGKVLSYDQSRNAENRNEFAIEVQQKLKFVLGEMKEEFPNEINESFGSDELNFQEKIHKNKEILKEHRKKKEIEEVNKLNQKKIQKKLPPKNKQKSRNQSLYQKRAREYRDQSNENKLLQKKKLAFVKEKQTQQALKQIKQKESLPPKRIDKSNSKKNYPRVLSQKPSQKNLGQLNKNANLFDNIQNYLENPHQAAKSKEKNKKQLVGLSLKYAKRDLEDKIKAIDEKLGRPDQQNEDSRQNIVDTSQWRKIEINDKLLRCESSTFEKEIERINSLQEKNSHSLEKYLDHQKLLVELQYQKKSITRKIEIKSQ